MHASLTPKATISYHSHRDPMLSFFRRISKSKIGTWVIAAIGVAILAGFALADLSNFGTGQMGFGMGSSTLAQVGDQNVSDKDMSDAMQRRLQQVRQQRPDADYASVIGDFNAVLDALVEQGSLLAFADKYHFPLSKRLIDAEIAQIPGTKGLNGQFSEQAYQQFLAQQRLSDAEVRQIISGDLLQRLILAPVLANLRVPVGMATPYASMLLEAREGEAAIIPAEAFKTGLNPTDAQVQQYYAANRARYMIPEQRMLRIARIGPDQVSNVTASDQEIAKYYNDNKATYAASETRSLSQVVVQDQATANGIAQRAKGGATLAAAASPAGSNAAVTSLNDQSQQAYAGVAGNAAANAVFAASAGAVVGPIKTDFGWAVVKIDSVKKGGGKSLDQAKAEIAAKLNTDKRKGAIEDLVAKVQDALDNGSNFTEAVGGAKLPVTTTPLITANGMSRTDASYKLPPELAPVLKSGFAIAPNDEPEVVALGGDQGYAVVSPSQIVPSAPAPLANIHDQVASDWVNEQAVQRARSAAQQIAAKASGNASLADAIKAAGASLPAPRPIAARRIQISDAQGNIAPALRLLFTTGVGKSSMAPNPQGGGFFVVKTNKITPGNAMISPGLIGQVQSQLNQASVSDYAQEFVADLKREMKVKRNESAIQGFKARLLSSGG
ncbi:MAG TPA: peptidyl-prolyl cis-trans isomerase [Sphingomicrobium sp.]|jgi:peptidyl-prolyl cis-trans isomerase D